jgi:hypothetical protein
VQLQLAWRSCKLFEVQLAIPVCIGLFDEQDAAAQATVAPLTAQLYCGRRRA